MTEDEEPRSRNRGISGLLTSGLLLLFGTPVALFFAGLAAMSTDSCSAPDQRPMCGSAGNIIAFIPLYAVILGFVVLLSVGIPLVVRRKPTGVLHLGIWVVIIIAFIATTGIASQGDSAAYTQRQDRQLEKEQQQQDRKSLDEAKSNPNFAVARGDIERLHDDAMRVITAQEPDTVSWKWGLFEEYWNQTCQIHGPIDQRTIQVSDHGEFEMYPAHHMTSNYPEIDKQRWDYVKRAFQQAAAENGYHYASERTSIDAFTLTKNDIHFQVSYSGEHDIDISSPKIQVDLTTGCHFK